MTANAEVTPEIQPGGAMPLDTILIGDCIEALAALPAQSVDLVFADPPYNLQLRQELRRPNATLVDAVTDKWDQFAGFADYDRFTRAWLSECRRVLKRDGAIWVIGTYHNIFRVGAIMQDLGFWILNDVVWIKTNPMPNFRGVRLTNAHETLIWAAKTNRSKYTFNYHAAKAFNGGKQLRSDWVMPLCTGSERLRVGGRKVHSTQKPEALLERVLIVSSVPGQVVLDPFAGTGTTAAVAKRLGRRWIGIEQSAEYVTHARERVAAVVTALLADDSVEASGKRRASRVPFRRLVEIGALSAGDRLYFRRDVSRVATVTPAGLLRYEGQEGSIHQIARLFTAGSPCNGWEHWYYKTPSGSMAAIDELRRLAGSSCDGGPAPATRQPVFGLFDDQ